MHIAEARGLDTNEILEHEVETGRQGNLAKLKRIQLVMQNNRGPKDIIRVIAQGLDSQLARTIESFAIHHVFGISNLTNIQSGEQPNRFRDFEDWQSPINPSGGINPACVYVLRDPESLGVFYVGKGRANRPEQHFKEARLALERLDSGSKILTIQRLLERFQPSEIIRIIASDLTDDEAFAIESFSLKYVFATAYDGANTNEVSGHHPERFRAKGDWTLRYGFDLPFLVTSNGAEARRMELDIMCGAKYHECLQPVIDAVGDLKWIGPNIVGAGALAFIAQVSFPDGSVGFIHVFTFGGKKVQIELRGTGVGRHLARFDYVCRRSDMVYFPDEWYRGPARETTVAIERLKAMHAFVRASDRAELQQLVGDRLESMLLGVDEVIRNQYRAADQQVARLQVELVVTRYRELGSIETVEAPELIQVEDRSAPPEIEHSNLLLDEGDSGEIWSQGTEFFRLLENDERELFKEIVQFARQFSIDRFGSPAFKTVKGYTGQPGIFNKTAMLVFADLHTVSGKSKPNMWIRVPLNANAELALILPPTLLDQNICPELIEKGASGSWRPRSIRDFLDSPNDYLVGRLR